jgi:predicted TIM-barrel fold metal-dependent hydrolase
MGPFWHRIKASDPRCFPIYEACSRLGLVLWVHNSVNLAPTYQLSYEHPLHLDEIAAEFPDLRIIAGHGGWPWIADMVAVAWRQPNVYIETSTFRPHHIAATGSGWEMLHYYMQRTLQDKVLFGSTAQAMGRTVGDLIAEIGDLELRLPVAQKWVHDNAARLFTRSE